MIAPKRGGVLQEKKQLGASAQSPLKPRAGLDHALWLKKVVEMAVVAWPRLKPLAAWDWACARLVLQEKMGSTARRALFDAVVAVTPLCRRLSQTEAGLPVVERLAASARFACWA
ncbi:hypothetical protein J4714_14410 [Staphylococcus epidermidis]|nr:hypothetical protein [Staphylococcus epidermidis]